MTLPRAPSKAPLTLLCKWVCLLALLLCNPVQAQQASVRSELSASTITRDESVTLTVTAVGVDGELDTSALDKDFDVVGQSSSRQIRTVVNGNNQPVTLSIVSWSLELLPRDVGVFTIPSVSVGGVSSQLLSLTVNEIPTGVQRDVFVEASVDTRNPWVQSQVLMTVRVFQAIEIVEGGLSDPAGEDIQIQRIGKDSYSNEVRDGREYRVTERRFALFPQKSGAVSIDPVVLSVSVATNANANLGFFAPTRKLTRRSDPITLNVQARPPTGTSWWLPASAVQLESNWADDVSQAAVDQPLTRSIVLRAAGVLDTQLPDIRIPAIDGVSLYAEEPVRAMGMSEQRGLVAEQTIKWALIPQREGELILPELSIEWFNTETGQTETAFLPEERIQVGPSSVANSSLSVPAPSDSGGNGPAQQDNSVATQDATAGSISDSAPDADASVQNAESSPPQNAAQSPAVVLSEDSAGVTDVATGVAGETGAQTGNVAPNPADSSQPIHSGEKPAASLWRLATWLLLGLWLLSLGGFLWWRRTLLHARAEAPADGGRPVSAFGQGVRHARQKLAPLAEIETACKGGDPLMLRNALLTWAARQWPQQAPATLTDLAQRIEQGAARQSLEALDAALYSRTPARQGSDELMQRMRTLPGELSEALKAGQSDVSAEGRDFGNSNERRGRGLPAL